MLSKLAVTLFIVCTFFLPADNFQLLHVISGPCDYFTTDNIGNLYVINKDEIQKYNNQGTLLQKYSNKTMGNIQHVDASNPLKILLFYKDFSQIIFLNNMLAPNAESVALEKMNLQMARLACTSFNNGIWIYTMQNFELVRLNESLQVSHQTGNLMQQLGTELDPNFLIEFNNRLYLNNPKTGILVFDIYGTYYKTLPIFNLSKFQVTDHHILYFEGQRLKKFDLNTQNTEFISLPDSNYIYARAEKNMLIASDTNGLRLYNLK